MEISRDYYLRELVDRMNNSLVKVITGIRRCGKSYLLNIIFYKYLLEHGVDDNHIIKIGLDDLANIPLRDAIVLDKYIRDKIIDEKNYYLVIDEIQEVNDFVPLLNGLMKIKNIDIYVTGSNSKFLSTDIITEFRGRGDQIHVTPLSFKECYQIDNREFDLILEDYLRFGGMPFLLTLNTEKRKVEYLSDLYKLIYLKDIKERYGIKNDLEMAELLDIVSSSMGSLTNPTKLENTFKSVKNVSLSRNTINSYLQLFEESFLVESVSRYDIKGKRYINSTKKYYFSDLGLRNARLNFRQIEENHLMENLIYNELKNRGYNVDVGIVEINERKEDGSYVRKQLEVDFVCNSGYERIYIQSAYYIEDSEKRDQEERSLININDSFKKVVIVRNHIKKWKDDNGVLFIGLKEFLLNPDSIND